MSGNFDEHVDREEDESPDRPDPVARALFIIITSAVVFAIAVLELWLWAN